MKNQKASQLWPLILFTIGVFMAGLDNGIIGTALTTINESFGVSPSWGAWSITLYTLGIAISVPIVGKLADRYGRRRMFLAEITLFGLGSLFVALSPNFMSLLIARFIQAIGGGGIFIIGSSHILATMPKEKQGKALGMLGGMHGLSAIVGPNLGALILQVTGSWKWMFLINIPIALFLIVFGALKIPESRQESKKSLDFTGTILLSISILSFMLGITQLEGKAWQSIYSDFKISILFLNSIFLLTLLLFYEKGLEKSGGDPILSLSLLSNRLFQITLFIAVLSGGFLATIVFIPSYVQEVLQVPVEQAGFWLTPFALMSGVGAGVGGVLTDRIGPARTVMISGLIAAIGFSLFPLWVTSGTSFIIASITAGVGFGFLLGAPLNVLVGMASPSNDQGSALGLLSLSRQVGLTIFPAVFAGFLTRGMIDVPFLMNRIYGDNRIIFPKEATTSREQYEAVISQVETYDLPTQKEMYDTIAHILKNGYDSMFYIASLLSLLVLLGGLYLYKTYTHE